MRLSLKGQWPEAILASRKISWKIRLFRLKKLFLKCFKPFVLLKKKQEEKFLSLRAVAFIQGPI